MIAYNRAKCLCGANKDPFHCVFACVGIRYNASSSQLEFNQSKCADCREYACIEACRYGAITNRRGVGVIGWWFWQKIFSRGRGEGSRWR